jgi:hypothetical protein
MYAGSTLLLAKQSLDEAPYKLSRAAVKLASITFDHFVCSSPDRLNLGFLLREKTCCCAHHTFRLEFPNCLAIIINYTPDIKPFSGAIAGEEVEDFCEGSFLHAHPLLCFIILLYFILFALFY